MRVVYATMNGIGRRTLEELADIVDVVGLFTIGERGKLFMDPTDFAPVAEKHGFPLHKITNINAPEVAQTIRDAKPDLGMCIGWKQIIKPEVLGIPRYGWIGCHPAKLLFEGEEPDPDVFSAPGNEPLQYAIRGGFAKTGTSLQWLKPTIDEGEVFAQAEIPLDEHETAATLIEKLGEANAKLVRDGMQSIIDGNPPRRKQQLKGTQPYTKPLTADDNRIDVSAPVEETYALIRSVVYPYPNAFIELGGTRIYVENARLVEGKLTDLKLRIGGSPYAQD